VDTDCNVLSRRADTTPHCSARSKIDDRQQGIREYTRIEGWTHPEAGADKVGTGLVVRGLTKVSEEEIEQKEAKVSAQNMGWPKNGALET
jgi:hypothetical protein